MADARTLDDAFTAFCADAEERQDPWPLYRRLMGEAPGPLYRMNSAMMINVDPPDHTRLRGLCNKALLPSVLEQRWRPVVEEITHELIDAVIDSGQADLVAGLGAPLPIMLIARLIGLDEDDFALFHHWSNLTIASVQANATDADRAGGDEAAANLVRLFNRVIERRRRDPSDDLVSLLIAAEEAGDQLTTDEIISNLLVIFLAGHETTANLIPNGVYALLTHPDQLELLRRDPTRVRSAVEECLRWETPARFMLPRIAVQDWRVGDVTIPAGSRIFAIFSNANRDPAVFDEPDRFDITREPNRNIAFGVGIHFCIGAFLARMEAAVAFTAVLERMPDIRLVSDKVRWLDAFATRGLQSLPVTF